MTKKLMTMMAAALIAAGVTMAADRPADRQRNQRVRIAEGVQSGELTRGEARRLDRQQDRLHREIRRDRVDGGGLTRRERAKIEAKQDGASRRIMRQKHDGQTR